MKQRLETILDGFLCNPAALFEELGSLFSNLPTAFEKLATPFEDFLAGLEQ
jgi:hypothetical protein